MGDAATASTALASLLYSHVSEAPASELAAGYLTLWGSAAAGDVRLWAAVWLGSVARSDLHR